MKALFAALAVALAALPASALAGPKAAAADTTAQAKAHFKKGTELYKQARYKDAIAEFEAAYKAKPHGVLFFNIAQCHEKLGDIPNALRSYHEYLRQTPDADDRATVEVAMRNLEKRLAEKGVQQVLVYSDPPGARVFLDGTQKGVTPYAAELILGAHVVKVVKDGFTESVRDITVVADRSMELDFALQKPGAPVAPPVVMAALPPEKPALEATARPEITPPGPPPAPPPEEKGRLWTWVTLGVGGAALATAVGFGAAAKSAETDLHARVNDHATAQSLADSARTRATVSNVFWGVGGVAVAAGTTLFFVEGRF